jgi:pyridoxal phosphate enzyme (YggS family)
LEINVIRVTENLRKISESIAATARRAGRDPASVTLVAVAKRQPLERVREAAAAGQRDFGENFLQEALETMDALDGENLIWHFIGAIQSNKTRPIAEHFDWVHTVDRAKIARRLNEQRPPDRPPLNICIQVNVDDEETKSGCAPEATAGLAATISEMPRLRLRGLMCIPAPAQDLEAQRRPFARLRSLLGDLNRAGYGLDTLSMGMSADLEAAILEGATLVRVGTDVFGPRPDRVASA